MLEFLATALDYRRFFSTEQLIAFTAGRVHPATPARLLMIYDTDLIRIWLVADRTNLYVVYDDRAWDKPTLAAPMPLDQAMPIAVEEVPASQIRFGTNPKAWRFSSKLFQRVSVKAIVEGFIADTGT